MGRINDPDCQRLAEEWSDRLLTALDDIARNRWPPFIIKRGFLAKPQEITPYSLEGPVQMDAQVCWSVAHVRRPSTFNETGILSPGERDFWFVSLRPGSPPTLTIEGAKLFSLSLVAETDVQAALDRAAAAGPKHEDFYGNKGPLRHR